MVTVLNEKHSCSSHANIVQASMSRMNVLTKSKNVNTNLIAEKLQTKAYSLTEMIKKLADKHLVNYQKYKGVSLT